MDKGWEKAGYAPRQVVTLQRPEDGVKVRVEPSSRAGWKVSVEGQSKVCHHQFKHVISSLMKLGVMELVEH